MGILNGILGFCKKNAGWILTGLGAAGFVTTTILVAKEAPEAEKALDEAYMENPELTVFEKIDILAPIYLPAVIVGGTTLCCMFGAQIFNAKQQAALLAAYGLLGQEFANYRKAVRKEVGEEKEREIYISNQKEIKQLKNKIKRLEKSNGPELYTFASLPGVIFESTPAFMNKVFQHMLWMMIQEGGFSLLDLYEHTCLPESCYDKDEAADHGYLIYENEITYGNAATTFEITDVKRQDGRTVHVIGTVDPPYELNMDYGGKDCSVNYLYDGYNWERACSLAQASVELDVEKFEQIEPVIVQTI